MKVVCVAEKPSIAKAVAQHLSGGEFRTRSCRDKHIKNYDFPFTFPPPLGRAEVTMTSVKGHLLATEFGPAYRGWKSCDPSALFEAPIFTKVSDNLKDAAENISREAKYARYLMIWTDCDREGEHIGSEIMNVAKKANNRIVTKRAQFSNIERSHIIQAASRLHELDLKQAQAVETRIELDLRLGAAFTRMLTLNLQTLPELQDSLISYGPCQFPTMGFVVDRYLCVANFKPEPFWSIKVQIDRDGLQTKFLWKRVHLFDRMVAVILFEKCLEAGPVRVAAMQRNTKSKWRPLPLTTVELQKQGSRYLRLSSKKVMDIAESLYTKGFISYPRTETDQFDKVMDLKALIQKQSLSNEWGDYATQLLDGNFKQPRAGTHNDKAHPPIHPIAHIDRGAVDPDSMRVYEFITRRFLACCSDDAKGEAVVVELDWGGEKFTATGLTVLERNYLNIYPYDKWESTQVLPTFTPGETITVSQAELAEGKTTSPAYITEPELISLMDENGIGTDATIAEHIDTVQQRGYVCKEMRRQGAPEFLPSNLGIALVEAFDSLGFHASLTKPFLRQEMEAKLGEICEGKKFRSHVVNDTLNEYRQVFVVAQRKASSIRETVQRHCNND